MTAAVAEPEGFLMSPADEPPELKVSGKFPITTAFFDVGSTPATWKYDTGRGLAPELCDTKSTEPTER